ncbi:uncharacterized protein F5Z01DRAFT_683111 [Emericellopsis atlantica]|uniref:Zn(2)-C6 fungal-type domain-containing protein n=1 Tax=Emericellopsis atlantica TaxID=2614577 RepID=A0A9P7ZHS3_9HYPO|nr:uncharacterized protein F5Z01DRAFT_683111 [Emericellopsis atlantica]KAG9251780.1 hypothetical protein F5Z01DRAFT_683111 [Emericellopsis atlantica]
MSGSPQSPESSALQQQPSKHEAINHEDVHEAFHTETDHANVHAYASNGLEILQAASDAAQGLTGHSELQAAVADPSVEPTIEHHGLSDASAVAALAQAHMAQPQTQHPQHGLDITPTSHQLSESRDPTVNPKLTRLRRACDMCSMRKVKCDDAGIPCKPCRELGVDCTYQRETKRRGPPNKHAEAAKAAKRARIEPLPASFPTPSPQMATKGLLNLTAEGVQDAESIAPMPVLELLIDDFFTYIHPLAPFPHEPTFRQSFANREDRTRPEFLGLIASMIGGLVASFPRSAREHLKAQHSTHLFPRAIVLIEKCRDIALNSRGPRFAAKQPKTLDDAATSYFLGLAASYTHQWNLSHFFMSETLTLIRELGFSRPKNPGELPTFGNDQYSPDPLPFNHVKDQVGKRIFWCLLLGNRSYAQLGDSQIGTVIPPSTPNFPYPAYPENIDDMYILANQINDQNEGNASLLTGYRFAIDIYTTMNGIVSTELAYGMSALQWSDQRSSLRSALLAVKGIIDDLPLELQLGNHGEVDPMDAFEETTMQYVPPLWPTAQPAHDLRNVFKTQPHRRRQLQYEIQKANIFTSQLATRSYFVELYFNLRDVHLANPHSMIHLTPEQKVIDDEEDKETLSLMTSERELIVENLLTVLGSISQRNLEPNGGSIINKIRQVASTLLNDAPERKGPFAIKSEEALSQLIDVLMKLEKTGPAGTTRASDPMQMTAQDEEEELRHWADLRDYQLRFAAHGGFTGNMLGQ